MALDAEFFLLLSLILSFATLIHGSVGFGFPMVATPLLAMFVGMKTAILYVAIPSVVINLISIYSEGNFLQAIRRFLPLALISMLGSAIGTQVLIYFDSEIFKLLLAASIVFYLLIDRFNLNSTWVRESPVLSMIVFGLVAGIIGGLTNVMASILIIYSLESRHSKSEIIQSSNLCFLAGKIAQIVLFSLHGDFTKELIFTSSGSLVLVIGVMFIGLKIKALIPATTYRLAVKGLLFALSVLLVTQVLIVY